MRNLSKSLTTLFLLCLPLSAQTGDGYGFLNIANLIPGTEKCGITIGGEILVPDGLKSGTYTGWFMVKPGSKSMSISLGELDEAKGSIEINEGLGNLVGIYLEPDKRLDDEGKPYPPKIRIKSFPTYDARGFGLKFVSLFPEESRFQLGSLKFEAASFKPVKIPKWNGGGFEIMHGGKSIGKSAGVSESGAFYLLIGTDRDGSFASVLVSSNPQEVPEYLKPKKKEPESPPVTSKTTTSQP